MMTRIFVERLPSKDRSRHCSLCSQKASSFVACWQDRTPYHYAFCMLCADAIGAAVDGEGTQREVDKVPLEQVV